MAEKFKKVLTVDDMSKGLKAVYENMPEHLLRPYQPEYPKWVIDELKRLIDNNGRKL